MVELMTPLPELLKQERVLEDRIASLETLKRKQARLEEEVFEAFQATLYYLDQSLEVSHSSESYAETTDLLEAFQGQFRHFEGAFEERRLSLNKAEIQAQDDLDHLRLEKIKEQERLDSQKTQGKELADGQS